MFLRHSRTAVHVCTRMRSVRNDRQNRCGLASLAIYHNPSIPLSMKMMDMLEDALKKPYPKPSKNPKTIVQPPLSFHLDVRQRIPTAEEFSELVYFTNAPVFTVFLKGTSSTSYKHHPTSATSLRAVLDDDPDAMRWPIVVNYDKQHIALDLSALRTILKTLDEDRKKQ